MKKRFLGLAIVAGSLLCSGVVSHAAQEDSIQRIAESQVGDSVTFGKYEQDNDISNGKEDIEWIVLEKEDDKAFLISKYLLDMIPYNDRFLYVTWETSTLRSWLNGEFFDTAFEEEKHAILTTRIQNKDSEFGMPGGNTTDDKIFCLSVDEVEKYFETDEERIACTTEYSKWKDMFKPNDMGTSCWWLRAPGFDSCDATIVYTQGGVYPHGFYVTYNVGVRPAMWVNLDIESIRTGGAEATEILEPTATPVPEIKAAHISKESQTGDVVTFGKYEQDNDELNGQEDIEWIVLEKENDKALLISKYLLDAVPYNKKLADVTWETCSLRSWLNSEFIDKAFEEEKNEILTTHIRNENSLIYGTPGGNDTDDKVFCLSIREAEQYFKSDDERLGYATMYAKGRHIFFCESTRACSWWLRSPGRSKSCAYTIDFYGCVNEFCDVDYHINGVRPVLWVSLE